jgi:hypothetical protein
VPAQAVRLLVLVEEGEASSRIGTALIRGQFPPPAQQLDSPGQLPHHLQRPVQLACRGGELVHPVVTGVRKQVPHDGDPPPRSGSLRRVPTQRTWQRPEVRSSPGALTLHSRSIRLDQGRACRHTGYSLGRRHRSRHRHRRGRRALAGPPRRSDVTDPGALEPVSHRIADRTGGGGLPGIGGWGHPSSQS